jgi:hypothetical protein
MKSSMMGLLAFAMASAACTPAANDAANQRVMPLSDCPGPAPSDPEAPPPPAAGTTVDIRDFGGCQGGDDTGAAQSALEALTPGQTLYVSCMANISATLTMSGERLAIRGRDGGGLRATADMRGAYASVLYLVDCTDCLVEGLDIDANGRRAELFVSRSTRTTVYGNTVHDIAYDDGGPPFAAIQSDRGVDNRFVANRVMRLGGTTGGAGVRGIWVGVGDRHEVRPLVLRNEVSSTGHTGIAAEGNGIVFRENRISDVLVQGTGMKIIHRGDYDAHDYVENNTVRNTTNAGFMIESSDSGGVFVRNNVWDRIGADGTSFGVVYVSGSRTTNVEVSGNTITNAKALANLNNAAGFLFRNNSVNAEAAVVLESNASGIRLESSGGVVIWDSADASDVWVDGVQIR